MSGYDGHYKNPENHGHAIPAWGRPGMLVRKKTGYTAMKVLKVDARTGEALVCYGPEDEIDYAERRTFASLRAFDPNIIGPRCQSHYPMIQDPTTMHYRAVEILPENGQPTNEKDDEMTTPRAKKNDLFTWNNAGGKPVFGTFLTENSDGQWIMETAGSKQPVAVDPNTCEKVMPYTVEICYEDGHRLDVKCRKGAVEVGDIVFKPSSRKGHHVVRVTAIDTKCDDDNLHTLKGRKLQTVDLDAAAPLTPATNDVIDAGDTDAG